MQNSKKLKRLGTDISLQTCRAQGYMTVQFRADLEINNVPENEDLIFGQTRPTRDKAENPYFLAYDNTHRTPKELYDTYLGHKSGINSFSDCDYPEIPKDIYDILFFS